MGDVQFRRIAGFGVTSADAARLAAFYETAFGARPVSSGHLAGAEVERRLGVRGGAERRTLQLGHESIDILEFETPGRPYPRPLLPDDTAFQHFALVVSDMDLALAQLQRAPGWSAISNGGPQHLPRRSGGVTAFKFQDPDGHPLELLEFSPQAVPPLRQDRATQGIFLGIDHSALSVRDTAVSTAFYRRLGFRVTAETLNHGTAQERLDGVPNPQVEVTALSLAVSTPHLELLCYRSDSRLCHAPLASNDLAATRIALAVGDRGHDADGAQRLLLDPDGHRLLLDP